METPARYEKSRYRSLDQALLDFLERRMLERIASAHLAPGDCVLDVPCGYGRMGPALLGAGSRVFCADIAIEMASRCAARLRRRADTVVADTVRLPFEDGSFDAAICMRLIQHGFTGERLCALMRELARVSRRIIVASFYETRTLHSAWRKVSGRKRGISMLDTLDFFKAARSAGLEPVSASPVLPFLHAHVVAVLRKTQGPGKVAGT